MKWLQANTETPFRWSYEVSVIAAKAGRIDLLKWANQNGGTLSWHAWDAALEANQFDCFKWLVENGCDEKPEEAGYYHFNNLDILLWAESRGFDMQNNSRAIVESAQANHCLAILVHMIEERGVVLRSLETAAAYGNLEALKYGHDNGMKLDDTNYAKAAYKHLNVLLWLQSIGYAIFLQDLEYIASNAAGAGVLNVLEWVITREEWNDFSTENLFYRICNTDWYDENPKAPDHIWEWALKSLNFDWQQNCSLSKILSFTCHSSKDFWWVLPKLMHSKIPEFFLNFLIATDRIAEIKWLMKNKGLKIVQSSFICALSNCKLEILELFRTHPKNCAFCWEKSFILECGIPNVAEWASNRYRI